jgi:hypothetical protein
MMTTSDAHLAAIALAGRLAELGETRLTLLQPGLPPRALTARETDLPATLLAATTTGGATLIAETLNIRITIDASGPHPADAHAASVLGALV